MKIPSEKRALAALASQIAEWTGVKEADLQTELSHRSERADGVVKSGRFRFIVEWKNASTTAQVATAIEQLRRYAESARGQPIFLFAAPYMGEAARKRCEEAGIAWADLSGNASIRAPGLRVLVAGQPNLYKRRGRPASAFAPKSSRIARWLLMHPEAWASQREIARDTGVGEGFTSKIVAKLEEDELIVRNDDGAIRARDPGLLLDAWREDYRFEKHQIIRGHIAARSGDILLRQLGESLEAQAEPYAATGLAAAWVLTRFAAFRTASLYLEQEPNADLIEALSFREEERGANVWLVVPSDEGVFHGATTHDGIRCVHPVQAYLDLGAQPERADAAAQRLEEDFLAWRNRG